MCVLQYFQKYLFFLKLFFTFEYLLSKRKIIGFEMHTIICINISAVLYNLISKFCKGPQSNLIPNTSRK